MPAGEPDSRSRAARGVRVLDLSRILSGPFATMVLADLGAEVIKLENPGTATTPGSGRPPYQGDQSAYFLAVNRNKRGIAVDLKTRPGARSLSGSPTAPTWSSRTSGREPRPGLASATTS